MKHVVRTTVVAAAVALGASLLAPVSSAGAVGDLSTVDVALTPAATGLNQPLAVAWRTGDPDMYVALKIGRVRRVSNGVVQKGNTLQFKVSSNGERGLLGLAFSPNGSKLYVDYTEPTTGHSRVDEYPINANKKAVKKARRHVLFQTQPYPNHNGGTIAFGPDGMLYIAFGDGGGAGDPNGFAQNKGSLLGKILRINPNPIGYYPYQIPAGNPFTGQPGARAEVFMYGLRNPWKFSFDKVTGDMWIGDVGQSEYEEIDFAAAGQQAGANWGWNRREASHPFLGGTQPPDGRDPIIERDHDEQDCAIVGGYVYRGTAIPALVGAYLYGDTCTGKIYAAEQQGGTAVQNVELGINVPSLVSFGQAPNGELYTVSLNGTVSRIVPG
jgi:glucose/arabinose dehydrogenase